VAPYRHLRIEEHGELAVVRIDRPPANALDPELLYEGHQAVEELAGAAPGAVVLTGCDGFFSAGVDLKLVPTLDEEGQRTMVAGINRLFSAWYGFPRPVVCAVNGHAIAGGLILALCGDYRVGAADGKLGLTEARAGVPYPVAAMAVVRAELSPPAARRLVVLADLVDPPAALDLGALDEVAPAERVLPRALEVAGELATLPAQAYELVKRQLRGPTIDAIRSGEDPLLSSWTGPETGEAARSVLGPRPS
jgi:enoyl-CoA hydratase/carnithine racemase